MLFLPRPHPDVCEFFDPVLHPIDGRFYIRQPAVANAFVHDSGFDCCSEVLGIALRIEPHVRALVQCQARHHLGVH
jgi:hypothetical protein